MATDVRLITVRRGWGHSAHAAAGTGEILVEGVAHAGPADAEAAIVAAHEAFQTWRLTPPSERARLLRRAADIMREHAEELALLDTYNTGNPIREMLSDANVAAASCDYFAGIIPTLQGNTVPCGETSLNYTVREPVGVVARIIAYNHPVMFAGSKLGPPLAAGCTVVLKAPEQAPLSCLRLAELLADVFPPGVLNFLPGGREAGQVLSTHPLVAKITLIGSIPTGIAIQKAAAATLKPTLLELGGKNALVAYGDADVSRVADAAVRGMNFIWSGQSCGSTSRLFLHDSIHDQVVALLPPRIAAAHQPGDPSDMATTMGPLVSRAQRDKVGSFIVSAKAEGATLLCGGSRSTSSALKNGYFVDPTVFTGVLPTMRVFREEVFGPVLSVIRWSDEAQMWRDVNSLEYGLTCSIWTQDISTALRAVKMPQVGYVWVNQVGKHYLGMPFGGRKLSGVGREESPDELLAFTELKAVNIEF